VSVLGLLIVAIVIAGAIGIVGVVARQADMGVPAFVSQVFWIVLAVVLGVCAVRFLGGIL
jgi:hypothetical protein